MKKVKKTKPPKIRKVIPLKPSSIFEDKRRKKKEKEYDKEISLN